MTTSPVYVIAEAGVNHNGSLALAMELVDAAAAAGVDAVKFQTFVPSALATSSAAQADYQVRGGASGGSLREMLTSLRIDDDDHRTLMHHAATRGIDFLSSPFDTASLDFLIHGLELPLIKVGSGEITNGPLLLRIARSGRPIILSTGMSTLDEISEALGVLAFGYVLHGTPTTRRELRRAWQDPGVHAVLREQVTLLHCTTAYPCPPEEVNLRAMRLLSDTFGLEVGYSDHTAGAAVSIAAVALGAMVIEKHLTLDRDLPGPDHRASSEPDEFAHLVRDIRLVSRSLGTAAKAPTAAELPNVAAARKSLVAATPIEAGDTYTPQNVTAKRPGGGRSPMDYWDVVGTVADAGHGEDERIP